METIYCFSTQKTNTLCWLTSNQAVSLYPSDKLSKGGKRLPNVEIPELNRRITSYEYDKVVDAAIRLGLTQGFMQEKSSAREEYTPPFDLEGL